MKINLKDFKLLDGTYSYVEHLVTTVIAILYIIQFLNKKSKDTDKEASSWN